MAVLSCLKYKTIPTSCMEYGHPWTDSCRDASIGLCLHAFQHSLRTYTTLYLFTSLLRRKKPSKEVILQTLTAILQSTAFLTTHAYGFSACLCSLRRLTGRFDVLSASFTPAFISSLVAIHIERPSRRPILCLYVTNIASETLFRMAVARGWVKPIRHGQVAIFALSMTSLLYRFRGDHSDDSMFSLIRFIFGNQEEAMKPAVVIEPTLEQPLRQRSKSNLPFIFKILKVYKEIKQKLKDQPRAHCCPHYNSCLYYSIKGGIRMFAAGYAVQVLMRTVLSLRKIYRKPSVFPKIFYSNKVFNLGAFLGLFTATFKGSLCALRWIRGKDSQEHSIPAGLLAGTAFFFYPDTTVALYVMWKALQITYNQLSEAGYLPNIPFGMVLLYAFSTSVLFHGCFVEPNNLRPSYLKFLDGLSGGRVIVMDRTPIDRFGFETSKHLTNMVRKLKINPDPRYTLRVFGNCYPKIVSL